MSLWIWLAVVAALLVVLAGLWLSRLAVRIDRLHRRVIATRSALGKTLVKRAADSLQLASSGQLAPDSSQKVAVAARQCLNAVEMPVVSDGIDDESTASDVLEGRRYVVESALSQALRAALDPDCRARLEDDPLGAMMLADLDQTSYRLRVTRTLHNQDVSLVRQLRGRLPSRLFHLAGRAPMPDYVDLDDGA